MPDDPIAEQAVLQDLAGADVVDDHMPLPARRFLTSMVGADMRP